MSLIDYEKFNNMYYSLNMKKRDAYSYNNNVLWIIICIAGLIVGLTVNVVIAASAFDPRVEFSTSTYVMLEMFVGMPLLFFFSKEIYLYLRGVDKEVSSEITHQILKYLYGAEVNNRNIENNDTINMLKHIKLWEFENLITKALSKFDIDDDKLKELHLVDISKNSLGIKKNKIDKMKRVLNKTAKVLTQLLPIAALATLFGGKVSMLFWLYVIMCGAVFFASIPLVSILELLSHGNKKVFSGYISVYKLNKKINGSIYIYPDKIEEKIGIYANPIQKLKRDKKLVKMEDIRFEREYVVYADDELDVRYILTPKMMELLTKMKKELGVDVFVSVNVQDMFIAVSSDKKMFKFSFFRKIDDDDLEEWINKFNIVKDVEKELKV